MSATLFSFKLYLANETRTVDVSKLSDATRELDKLLASDRRTRATLASLCYNWQKYDNSIDASSLRDAADMLGVSHTTVANYAVIYPALADAIYEGAKVTVCTYLGNAVKAGKLSESDVSKLDVKQLTKKLAVAAVSKATGSDSDSSSPAASKLSDYDKIAKLAKAGNLTLKEIENLIILLQLQAEAQKLAEAKADSDS